MLVRRHHQVTVGVRELVEDHEAALAAVDDQVRLVIAGLEGLAQKTQASELSLEASFTYSRRQGAQIR